VRVGVLGEEEVVVDGSEDVEPFGSSETVFSDRWEGRKERDDGAGGEGVRESLTITVYRNKRR